MKPAAAVSILVLVAAATQPSSPGQSVVRAARAFADGGGYSLKWGGSGTPEEVRFAGTRILPKGTEGTYCSGFTFAVAMRAAAELKLLDGKTVEQVKRFQREWYGAVDDPKTRERQCAVAVTTLGVGRSVTADDAKPGDFIQLWRNNKTGHSAVFLDWVQRDGRRIGFRYRSSQESTHGIGDKTEYFADTGIGNARVIRERIYFARLGTTWGDDP